ncbi:hypothetical protein JH06_1209 [Blastocystis sp. subtype 4]|uniref:hypothetical protein n=1 Tax=Blastocystis sp. subtype 4 TaxID=944170 RepID=UPI0007118838|nr:hypothetical protein JH06_1209 [Blastocystis sp. subtype 4]KNB45237.1 hypothetical protein JH06_1209 [Blastocystis sp. subtype 4]|eukprot:XP_014528680.1 hypothetical protein JH06_1209 [Blastocystis sp. subtype 4]
MKSILSIFLFTLVFTIYVEIPKGEIRCLYDEMGLGHKPQLYISVIDGGKHDIHFSVKSVGRDEVLLDIDLGTDPSHPPAIRNNDFEIPYFAEYMFCLDNSREGMSQFDKTVEIRFNGGEIEDESSGYEDELLKDQDIANVNNVMKDIQSMTEEIKGKQAAYRLQEESRRNAVMKTHERVSFVNLVEIVVFFAFSVVQIIIVKRWFSGKKAILG